MTSAPPKVFISYDSEAHADRVLNLANGLCERHRRRIDQYEDSPPEGVAGQRLRCPAKFFHSV
jgi:hypothetical protein